MEGLIHFLMQVSDATVGVGTIVQAVLAALAGHAISKKISESKQG